MGLLQEMSTEECLGLLAASVVGRAAICTPDGPHVVPVNYAVDGDSIVFRTTPYSVLGTYAWAGDIAFEVDQIDMGSHRGWSVVARGHGEMVEDVEEIEEIRWAHDPKPWAEGARPLFVRLRWRELTGRRIA
ncbi:MAG TPA: pyridoxamine 5'-phosphate oxidase family protein [Nocardioidaceae bacterium]|nr:pyridoxamine 5'-phosphate oxidase family protein [Nocardioidaceae bacterium]